jgi:hypothetical protein
MTELTTRQQATRSGHARRVSDPVSQQRLLSGLGVEVSLEVLRTLPPGAWIRFVPAGRSLYVGRRGRG